MIFFPVELAKKPHSCLLLSRRMAWVKPCVFGARCTLRLPTATFDFIRPHLLEIEVDQNWMEWVFTTISPLMHELGSGGKKERDWGREGGMREVSWNASIRRFGHPPTRLFCTVRSVLTYCKHHLISHYIGLLKAEFVWKYAGWQW
jgi:hypothetical protein